jgi:hypothetical protein
MTHAIDKIPIYCCRKRIVLVFLCSVEFRLDSTGGDSLEFLKFCLKSSSKTSHWPDLCFHASFRIFIEGEKKKVDCLVLPTQLFCAHNTVAVGIRFSVCGGSRCWGSNLKGSPIHREGRDSSSPHLLLRLDRPFSLASLV